jgi:hypothetical protein
MRDRVAVPRIVNPEAVSKRASKAGRLLGRDSFFVYFSHFVNVVTKGPINPLHVVVVVDVVVTAPETATSDKLTCLYKTAVHTTSSVIHLKQNPEGGTETCA